MPPYEELAAPLRPLEDNYELIRELGGTNPTVVYLARVRSSGRLVALKTIRSQFLRDSEAVARFTREARTMSALQHPNIVRTIAVEQIGQRTAAIVMEFLEGGSLREFLRSQGGMPFERVRAILDDLGEALRYAHGLGIVHRDVKPENIFIAEENGRAMLSDFGIARDMEMDTRLTIAGSAVGTPTYMSPEQIDGQAVDQRSDIYSLGVLGWELVTGLRPWDGETLYGVIYKQKNDELPAIRTLRADTPASLCDAIEIAMQKDATKRWTSATAFLGRLRDIASDLAAEEAGGADLPTLHFRKAGETLMGVPLANLPTSERPTKPLEREVQLRPARESIMPVAREPEVPEVVKEPEVREPRITTPRRRIDPPPAFQPTQSAERLAPVMPVIEAPAVALSDNERRFAPRIRAAELVEDEVPQRVAPPRARSPWMIAIPSAIALAAAALFMARREQQESRAEAATLRDTIVSTTSGGNVVALDSVNVRDVSAKLAPSRTIENRQRRGPQPNTAPATARSNSRAAEVARNPSGLARTPAPVKVSRSRGEPAAMPEPRVTASAADDQTPLLDRIADSDVELNRIYQQLIATLRRESPDDPARVETLRVQQRNWLMQRDVACRSGTIEERAGCFRAESRNRAMELRTRIEAARPSGQNSP